MNNLLHTELEDINYKKDEYNKIVTNSKLENLKRSSLKKSIRKYNKKIINRIKDMHFKVAHKITNKFDNIYIGKFNTLSILSNKNKTSESIIALQLYFLRRLRQDYNILYKKSYRNPSSISI